MDLYLKKKIVLISGSSKGIGLAIASNFLEEGSTVILTGRKKKSLLVSHNYLSKKYQNKQLHSEVVDFTNEKSVERLKNKIIKKFKKIDIVVANVGSGKGYDLSILNKKKWIKSWDLNFNSALNTSRVFLPLLEKSKGSLLYISSIAGLEVIGAPVEYSTAKFALIALAKNLSKKYSKNVRINVIAPGNIFFKDGTWDKKIKQNSKFVKKLIKETVPMNKFGDPSDISSASVFLCSSKAKFITGSVLVIDGGQTSAI